VLVIAKGPVEQLSFYRKNGAAFRKPSSNQRFSFACREKNNEKGAF